MPSCHNVDVERRTTRGDHSDHDHFTATRTNRGRSNAARTARRDGRRAITEARAPDGASEEGQGWHVPVRGCWTASLAAWTLRIFGSN